MTAEEITTAVLAALERGELPAEEAWQRLVAAGVPPDDAREAVGIALGESDVVPARAPGERRERYVWGEGDVEVFDEESTPPDGRDERT